MDLRLDLFTGEQQQITFPKENKYDRDPQSVYPYITWIREGSSRDAWIKEGVDGQEILWIENMEEAPVLHDKTER
ncbi:hypothetical protein FIU87_12710 [Bacillus sp. THAF10]|uniref:hypothetical protein n=1 Tax=Bacillus sp. THAF10 TaxID=2587848 RepID=UPI001268961F|nr:hypothetical protein [Bacillus sp. THAF10]QFT89513.1 hypothetical protein FIU87_12710 [Bacillus sp. THAF10]